MTPEEFRKFGYRVVDWIADYRSKISELPVMGAYGPGRGEDSPAERSAGKSGAIRPNLPGS